MVFSSPVFLFLFLPLVLTVYLLTPRSLKNVFLLISSLFFYAWGETFFIFVMILSILFNYLFGILIDTYKKRDSSAPKIILALAILCNIGLLVVFKYTNFIVENLSGISGIIPIDLANFTPVHLPIGISFFTFQALSYVIDIYRGDSRVQKKPVNTALYISLFPQLIAGPIVRYNHIAAQLQNRYITLDGFTSGVRRFIIGLGKKMLIANTLAVAADGIFSIPSGEMTFSLAWVGIFSYTAQIYFDFSGYSDMAIGLGG
ncbi:MAG: MBOAT family protein, partial [Proteobacteria bacterium]|nr:MBOAT family protein [Pseudomonadota bacterium]